MSKRQQTQKMENLLKEFHSLKEKIFGKDMFVTVPDKEPEEHKRYDQLLAYFNPCFRTQNWINPMQEEN